MSSLTLAAFLVLTIVACDAASPKLPTFFDRRDYPGLYGTFVQVADTNGDGIPDIIASQHKTGYIEVLLGNGNGTFRTGPNSLTVATGADSLAAADLNGDGKIDLALANYSGIVVATGNGNGTFGSGVLYSIDDVQISFLVVGDFNNDGIPDIAAAGSAGLWLLTGKGGGLFNSAVLVASLPGSANVAAADFNQDGNLDVVVTQPNETDGGFAVLFGQGNGAFQTPQMFGAGLMPNALAVGSLTPGGPPSIAVDNYNVNLSQVDLYYGNGAGGFSAPSVVTLPEVGVEGLSIGDVNGDGIPDLVSDNGYVVFGEGGGSFSKPVNYPVSNAGNFGIANAVLADLRSSGGLDIVTNGGADSISVLLNLGEGFLEDGIFTEVGQGPLCAADFNGDGKPDLAVSTFQYGATILLGTGKPRNAVHYRNNPGRERRRIVLRRWRSQRRWHPQSAGARIYLSRIHCPRLPRQR
jgi:hypothetical protein